MIENMVDTFVCAAQVWRTGLFAWRLRVQCMRSCAPFSCGDAGVEALGAEAAPGPQAASARARSHRPPSRVPLLDVYSTESHGADTRTTSNSRQNHIRM